MRIRMGMDHPRHGWVRLTSVILITGDRQLTDPELRRYAGLEPDAMDERIQMQCKSLRGPTGRDRLIAGYRDPVSDRVQYMIVPAQMIGE